MSSHDNLFAQQVATWRRRQVSSLSAQEMLAARVENAVRAALASAPFLVAAEQIEPAAQELHAGCGDDTPWGQLTEAQRFYFRRLALRMFKAADVDAEPVPENEQELASEPPPSGGYVPCEFKPTHSERAQRVAEDRGEGEPRALHPLEGLQDLVGSTARGQVLGAPFLVSAQQQYAAARDLFIRLDGDEDRSTEPHSSGRYLQWERAWTFASPRKQARMLLRAKAVLEAAGLPCAPAL